MRNRLIFLGGYIMFWLSFEVAARALFLLYHYSHALTLTLKDVSLVFAHGLRMDMSMTGYFALYACLFMAVSTLDARHRLFSLFHFSTFLFIALSSLVSIADMELYRHWGFRLDTTPFFYMGQEAMGSVDIRIAFLLAILFFALFGTYAWLYKRWLIPLSNKITSLSYTTFIVFLPLSAFMVLPIRGSISIAPMNTGFVYFHPTKPFANHAAINATWNFLYSLQSSGHFVYPEGFFNPEKSITSFDSLYTSPVDTKKIIAPEKPNIILIILEGFTSNIIEPLGGLPDITPNLNQLYHEGIMFDHFYASGDRTEKGVLSILSGYPAQPQTSLVKYPNKTKSLPSLCDKLNRLGYHSSFLYGGDVNFANLRSFLVHSGFQKIFSMDDFPDELNTSKWGVHDQYVFAKALDMMDTATTPYFHTLLTLSSHEPFDVPHQRFKEKIDKPMFLNSCHYTDSCLGAFIRKAQQKEQWKNTLVVITADHGHRHPFGAELFEEQRYRIPLLLLGGSLLKKDTLVHTYGGQTDLVNTLLGQVDSTSSEFRFSKDLFNPGIKSFAFYFYNNGYGFVRPGGYLVFDNTGQQFTIKEGADSHDEATGHAYQQTLFSDYNKR